MANIVTADFSLFYHGDDVHATQASHPLRNEMSKITQGGHSALKFQSKWRRLTEYSMKDCSDVLKDHRDLN